jgi:hypothetical protein
VFVVVVIASVRFVEEAAPKEITIIASPPGTTDHEYASSYAAQLEARGLRAKIIEASGGAGNVSRMLELDNSAMTFVMSGAERGLDNADEADEVFSVGSIALEPLWIFIGADSNVAAIGDLDGARVLLGPRGTDSFAMGRLLIDEHRLEVDEVTFDSVEDVMQALENGGVEAGFFVGDPRSEGLSELLADPRLRPLSLQLAEAYVVRSGWLSAVSYPRGAFDLRAPTPSEDLSLVAGAMNVVVPRGTHPALIDLLLDIATQLHSERGTFWDRDTFPSAGGVSLSLDPVAARFYREGPSPWRRVLPYRLASIVDRLTKFVIPALTALLVVFRLIPGFFHWRLRRRLKKLWRSLQIAEQEAENADVPSEKIAARLDSIDRDSVDLKVMRSDIPSYFELRQAIHDFRERLSERGKI